ncbi:MAG: discoidin domain-containing protein, partial [Chloroflexi bacterium]|nr:discoidin domain-containing protein [Chloroflexota bacterium]
ASYVYDGDGTRVKSNNVYQNLAAGVKATTSGTTLIYPDVITNGDAWADSGDSASREYAYTTDTGLRYVQLDLGAAYSVDQVVVWHYAADGRTYHNTKTQVSADGSTWYTVFDSAVSGEYAETAAGKTHSFTARSVRYVRDYVNGSTANIYNHWVEIQVWGRANVAYVGNYYEWRGSTKTQTKYYTLGGQRVALRASNGTSTDGLVYLLSDHLGSTSLTLDPVDGDKLTELRYQAYGQTRYTSGTTSTARRFTGQLEESTIGLYDYGARFYDPLLGRFVSADTIVPGAGNPQALNRYSYVFNNPLKYTDPTGHWAFEETPDDPVMVWTQPNGDAVRSTWESVWQQTAPTDARYQDSNPGDTSFYGGSVNFTIGAGPWFANFGRDAIYSPRTGQAGIFKFGFDNGYQEGWVWPQAGVTLSVIGGTGIKNDISEYAGECNTKSVGVGPVSISSFNDGKDVITGYEVGLGMSQSLPLLVVAGPPVSASDITTVWTRDQDTEQMLANIFVNYQRTPQYIGPW